MATNRETITSPQNSRVKQAIRLRDAKHRRTSGLTLIDGVRELQHAVDAGIELQEVFFNDSLENVTATHRRELAGLLEKIPASVLTPVSSAVLEKLSFGDRNEGVVAVAAPKTQSLSSLNLAPDAIVLVLDQVEKPGNLGAVMRSADAAGAAAVVLSNSLCDPFNPNAIRASQGAIFRLPLASEKTEIVQQWLTQRSSPIWGARVDGSIPYTQAQYLRGGAIVLGNEANGLGDNWRIPEVQAIALPMLGAADSLNVSVTAAVILYEALRQRTVH